MLLAFLRRRCGSVQDAEDLRQETLLRVFRRLDSYDPDRPFEPWLMAIASRLATDRARRLRPAQALPDGLTDAGPDPREQVGAREAGAALWRIAAGALTPGQYRALRLRYVDGLCVRDVAARMGVSTSNAKVLLFRARRRLTASPRARALLDASAGPAGGPT